MLSAMGQDGLDRVEERVSEILETFQRLKESEARARQEAAMWKQMYEQERARWSDEPRDHPPDLDLASELAIVNFGFDSPALEPGASPGPTPPLPGKAREGEDDACDAPSASGASLGNPWGRSDSRGPEAWQGDGAAGPSGADPSPGDARRLRGGGDGATRAVPGGAEPPGAPPQPPLPPSAQPRCAVSASESNLLHAGVAHAGLALHRGLGSSTGLGWGMQASPSVSSLARMSGDDLMQLYNGHAPPRRAHPLHSVTMTDDGAAGVGVAAAAAQAIAVARAWARFTHDSRSQVHRRSSLPGRVAYQVDAAMCARASPGEDSVHSGHSGAGPESANSPLLGMSRPALTLRWINQPQTVLVVAKQSPPVLAQMLRVVTWLKARGLIVFVEPEAYRQLMEMARETAGRVGEGNGAGGGAGDVLSRAMVQQLMATLCPDSAGRLVTWACRECGDDRPFREVIDNIDVAVTLGGDGTVLWTCSLFRDAPAPPMVSFAMGSLGFMTPFPFESFEVVLERILRGGFPMMVRHRIHATIRRAGGGAGAGASAGAGGGASAAVGASGEVDDPPVTSSHVALNEVVLDRGPTPYLTNLVAKCDGAFVTRVQGDGLIIATPSGSTAYSLAAGGSMVHPEVPGILFTPICPHSLSFRPVVFPDHIRLTVEVPSDARAEAYCSFDGRDRVTLRPGDSLHVQLSRFPIPAACEMDSTHDWFLSVRDTLHWNRRKAQAGADHGEGQGMGEGG